MTRMIRTTKHAETGAAWALVLLAPAVTVVLGFSSGGVAPNVTAWAAAAAAAVAAFSVLLMRRAPNRTWLALTLSLAALVGWTLLSGGWSRSTGDAAVESARTLLYCAIAIAAGVAVRDERRLRALAALTALALASLAAAGLLSRLAPDVVKTYVPLANERLGYPVGYWNGLGIVAAVAIVLALHFASDLRFPLAGRALAAAAVPGCGTTLYFTFSRGAIAATIVGVVVLLVIGRSRGLPAALIAVVPPTGLALAAAHGAGLLASRGPTTPPAVAQGHDLAPKLLALVVLAGVLRVALVAVDRYFERLSGPSAAAARRLKAATAVLLAVAVAGAALSAGKATSALSERISGGSTYYLDQRHRLTDLSADGRLELWGVAESAFRAEPFHGTGAGSYEYRWDRERGTASNIRDAHSLPLETLAELGVVGALLLGGTLIAAAAAIVRRLRGVERPLFAALLAGTATWVAGACLDWYWELPATGLWLFAVAGAASGLVRTPAAAEPAKADSRPSRTRPWMRWLPRAAGAAVLGAAAIGAGVVGRAEDHVASARHSLRTGDDTAAAASAAAARDLAPFLSEPHELLGYAAVRAGAAGRGQRELRAAIDKSPRSWRPWYGLALARAASGRDPRAALATATRLNPMDPRVQAFAGAERDARTSGQRRRIALRQSLPIDPFNPVVASVPPLLGPGPGPPATP